MYKNIDSSNNVHDITHAILDMRTFKTVYVTAETPELAVIKAHAEANGDALMLRYNDYLKQLNFNGHNIGLGSFCHFRRAC